MGRKGNIKVQIKNYKQLISVVKAYNNRGSAALEYTVKDMRSRAPGWVAQEVAQVYNIKKEEIKPTKIKKNGEKPKSAGTVKVSGDTIEQFTITYTGHLLTPVHFDMTPKAPTPGKDYVLRMQVYKGGKKERIGRYKATRKRGGPYSEQSHNILMGTGNTKVNGVNWIPFQRMSKKRTDLKKFTTVSLPQMVDNEVVNENIYKRLNEETEKRLTHHMKRLGIG